MTFSLRFHAHSEVGRIRKNNQDSAYASPTMLLVADGMGGAAAGDLASAVATVTAQKLDRAVPADDMLEFIGGVVVKANDRLLELIEEDPTLDGMDTTFCGASFDGQYLALAHIGDSRMYRLRGDAIEQLTHDHSWVQTLIDEGRLTPEQAATHPHRSLILKVLNGQTEPDPDYQLLEVSKGDRYLFCSGGLSGLIRLPPERFGPPVENAGLAAGLASCAIVLTARFAFRERLGLLDRTRLVSVR